MYFTIRLPGAFIPSNYVSIKCSFFCFMSRRVFVQFAVCGDFILQQSFLFEDAFTKPKISLREMLRNVKDDSLDILDDK